MNTYKLAGIPEDTLTNDVIGVRRFKTESMPVDDAALLAGLSFSFSKNINIQPKSSSFILFNSEFNASLRDFFIYSPISCVVNTYKNTDSPVISEVIDTNNNNLSSGLKASTTLGIVSSFVSAGDKIEERLTMGSKTKLTDIIIKGSVMIEIINNSLSQIDININGNILDSSSGQNDAFPYNLPLGLS